MARTYRAGVAGIKHNLYGLMDSGHDIVLIGEYAARVWRIAGS